MATINNINSGETGLSVRQKLNVLSVFYNTFVESDAFFNLLNVNTSFVKSNTPTGNFLRDDGSWQALNIKTLNGITLLGLGNVQVGTILGSLPAIAGLIPFTTGVANEVNTSSTFVRNANGYIGIKTSNPLAPLHVGDNNVNNSSDSQILISRLVNTGTGNGHAFSDSSNFSRSGNSAYNSYDARVVFSGTNNYEHYAAFQSNPTLQFTGNMTDYFGYFSQVSIINGTLTNNYGVHIKDVDGPANSVTNNYGVYIDNLTKASTNNYAIYSNGGAKSYFGGTINTNARLGVGGTFTPTKNIEIQTALGVEASLRLRQLSQNYWDFTIPVNQSRLDIVDANGINVTFKNLGNVGIKQINPLARLDITCDTSNHAIRVLHTSGILLFRVQNSGDALHSGKTYFGGSTGVALTPTSFLQIAPNTDSTITGIVPLKFSPTSSVLKDIIEIGAVEVANNLMYYSPINSDRRSFKYREPVVTSVSTATTITPTNVIDGYSVTGLATALTINDATGTFGNIQQLTIRLKDNGTAQALTWGANYIAMGANLPTTTVAGKVITVVLMYDSVLLKFGVVSVSTQA